MARRKKVNPLAYEYGPEGKPRFRDNFCVLPHAKAPLFKDGDAQAVGKQVLDLLANPKGISDKVIYDITFQTGLVNLWFFLKFIASASGPYGFLNEGVHLDLANFRQSESCMESGARAAIFLPRSFAKTTICTTGAAAWEAFRDPNIRMRIVNAVVERAHQFKNVARGVFDSNILIERIAPQYVPGKASARWTDREWCLPNATRKYVEPTCKAGGASGASEGDHHDILLLDDLIGLDNVDSDFNPNQNMESTRSWMDTNMTALLTSAESGRIVLVATRYGRGDVYQQIFDNCRAIYGYPQGLPNVKADPDLGTWDIYYRHVVENGKASNPFIMSVETFERLLVEKPMVAALQYANNVDISINNEFAKLKTKNCLIEIEWNEREAENVPLRQRARMIRILCESDNSVNGEDAVNLDDCTVVISVDWAGSKKARNARSSRTSIGVWALDAHGRYFRIDGKVGFFDINEVFDWIFKLHRRWEGYVRNTLVEANAMQLGIVQLLKVEEQRRGAYLNVTVVNAKGDKVARIRSMLGLPLSLGTVYVSEGAAMEFREEQLSFPMGRLDVLDESAKAFEFMKKPATKAYTEMRRAEEELRLYNTDRRGKQSAFGY